MLECTLISFELILLYAEELKPLLNGYKGRVFTVDARRISVEALGKYFPNSPMLAAAVAVSKVMSKYEFIREMKASYEHKFAKKPEVIEGNMNSYLEMPDGTWQCNRNTYEYRLVISGKMPNADKDTTFVYLSNIAEITFEQALKASGLSSNAEDYFNSKDAVLVEMKTD